MENVSKPGPFVLHVSENTPSEHFPKRTEKWAILENVRCLIHRGNDGPRHLRSAYRATILKNLEELIEDKSAELRYESLSLLCETVPHLGEGIDHLMKSIFPKIVSCLGHCNLDVRLVTIHLVCVYLKYTTNLQTFLKAFVQHGIESPVENIRRGCLIGISTIFDIDMTNENLFPLVKSLGEQLTAAEPSFFYTVFFALRKINQIVRDEVFCEYLQRLDVEVAVLYQRTIGGENVSIANLCEGNVSSVESSPEDGMLAYGIFDPYILEQLKSKDSNVKTAGVQSIRNVIQSPWKERDLEPKLDEFLLLLGSLLSDRSKRVRFMALDIVETVVQKIGYRLGNHLHTIVEPLMKNFGCRESRIRKLAIRVVHQLMREIHPMPIIRELLFLIQTQRSTVREEIINRITAALLSFPSYDFDLPFLCRSVLPFLNETIPRLKQAVTECLVILAKVMESVGHEIVEMTVGNKYQVDAKVDEIFSIVEVRAAHQILPTCSNEGIITYSHFDPQHFEVLCSKSSAFSDMNIHRDLKRNIKPAGSSPSGSTKNKRKTGGHGRKHKSCNLDSYEEASIKSGTESQTTASDTVSSFLGKKDGARVKRFEKTESSQPVAATSAGHTNELIQNESLSIAEDCEPLMGNQSVAHISKECQRNEFSFYTRGGSTRELKYDNDYLDMRLPPPDNTETWDATGKDSELRNSSEMRPLPSPPYISSSGSQECPELQACCCELQTTSPEAIAEESADIPLPESETFLQKTKNGSDSEPVATRTSLAEDVTSSSRSSLKEERRRNLWKSSSTVEEESEGSSTTVQSDGIPTELTGQDELDLKQSDNIEISSAVQGELNRTFISPASSTPKKVADWRFQKTPTQKFDSPVQQNAIHLVSSEGLRRKRHSRKKASRASNVLYFNNGQEVQVEQTSSQTMWLQNRKASHEDVDPKANVFSPAFRLPPVVSSSRKTPQQNRNRCLAKDTIYLPPIDPHGSHTLVCRHEEVYETKFTGSSLDETNSRATSNQERLKILGEVSREDKDSHPQLEDDLDASSVMSSKRMKRRSERSTRGRENKHVRRATVIIRSSEKESSTQEVEDCDPCCGDADSKDEDKRNTTSEEADNSKAVMHKTASEGSARRIPTCTWETQFEESVQNIKPLTKPEIAVELMKQANTILSGENWKLKIEVMLTVISVAKFHPFALEDYMPQIFTKLIGEVKTSKPSVAGAAILTIGHLFLLHRKALEPHIKVVLGAFLSKCGTKTMASSFNIVIKSMFYIIQGMQPQKAAMAFLDVGCRHRNKVVRETAAQFLTLLVEKMGHIKCLQSSRNLSDGLLNCAANFVTDGSPVTRYCGKRIFQVLMKHQNFTKAINKYLPENGLRNIHRILEALRVKGLSKEILPIRLIWPDDI